VRGVRVGLTICYDVRFPELYRRLALAGAEVLLVPAAFTQTTGEAHWEVLLRARAVENAAFVVASATVRSHDGSDAWATYGHALVVDPWGAVLADLGEAQRAVKVVELDLGQVERVREQLPVLRGTRPDAYAAEPQSLQIA
jgi:predicted amidohydrolase